VLHLGRARHGLDRPPRLCGSARVGSRRLGTRGAGRRRVCAGSPQGSPRRAVFFFKQKTAYEIGLGIPAEPLFRSSPLPALAIAPETKLGTASSGLGTLEP